MAKANKKIDRPHVHLPGLLINWIKQNILILVIFLLALGLRFYNLSEFPYGFDGDEAAFGYYGYSLISNLSDEFGNKLPLYFPSIGDFKYPVYPYLTTLPVAVFGLSEFSARFISALSGTLLVTVIYLFVKRLLNSKKFALIAAFFTAISPYGIIFSRGAFESNLATLFISLGILMIAEFSVLKRKRFLFLAAIFFIISVFTYSATRVFIPIFTLFYGVILTKDKEFKSVGRKYYVFFFLIISIIISVSFLDPRSRARAEDISIFGNYKIGENIVSSIWEDGIAKSGNIFITRVFHNKLQVQLLLVFEGYLKHFDPVYLFVTSNPSMSKYSIPGMGLFYFFEVVTFIFGLIALSKYFSNKLTYLLIFWIVLSPLPSALTVETPNPVRALMGFPSMIILSALGVVYLVDLAKRKWSKTIASLLLVFVVVANFLYFIHQYFVHDKYHRPWNTDGGMKELIASINKNESKYEKVIIPNDPYIFYLFYNKIEPEIFIKESKLNRIEVGKWEYVNSIGKLIFKMPYDCPKVGKLNVLYVCKGTEIPLNSVIVDSIRFSDGVPAYTLIEFVPYSQRKQIILPTGLNYMVETDLAFKEGLLSNDSDKYW